MSAEAMAKFAEIMGDKGPEPASERAVEAPERTIQQAVIAHAQNDLSAMPDASHMEDREAASRETAEPAAPDGPKFGAGHAMGMLRLGGHEITQALQAFPDSNITPMEEPGVVGNPTQPLITKQMGGFQDSQDRPAAQPEQGREFSIDDIVQASPTPQEPQAPEQQHERGGLEM